MKRATAVEHFGGVRKLAEALGITSQAVYQWDDDVPEMVAYKLQVITGGALQVHEPKAKTKTAQA